MFKNMRDTNVKVFSAFLTLNVHIPDKVKKLS